jgi:hypothetical protein
MLYTVPEIIDPVFAKTSQYARFLLSENERFGLVFVKSGSINSGTDGSRHIQEHSQWIFGQVTDKLNSTVSLQRDSVMRWIIFFEGLNVLNSTFCVCADGFQGC